MKKKTVFRYLPSSLRVKDFNPDEPREPKGSRGGGRWTKAAGGLAATLKKSGGFSYNVVGENSLKPGDKVCVVSPYKDRERVFDSITPMDLAQYVVDNYDLLSKDGHYFGGWADPDSGKVFLDVSIATPDRAEAEKLCRENEQLAYFDMEKMDTVSVGKKVNDEQDPGVFDQRKNDNGGGHRESVRKVDGEEGNPGGSRSDEQDSSGQGESLGDAREEWVSCTAAGILLVTPQRTSLFLRRKDDGTWCFPGGRQEEGESLETCARREYVEETGLAAPWGNLVEFERTISPEGVDFTTFIMLIEGEFTPTLEPTEHDAWCWKPLDAPPEPLHAGVALTLSKAPQIAENVPTGFLEAGDAFEESAHPRAGKGRSGGQFVGKGGAKPAYGSKRPISSTPIDRNWNVHFGSGYWYNIATEKLVEMDPGSLGPHGDHDGWITIGDNADKLGIDKKKATAFQVATWGPEVLEETNPYRKPFVDSKGQIHLWADFDHYTNSKEFARVFEKTFGVSVDAAQPDPADAFKLVRIRKWTDGTLSIDLSSTKITSDALAKIGTPEVLSGVKKVSVGNYSEGNYRELSVAEFLNGKWLGVSSASSLAAFHGDGSDEITLTIPLFIRLLEWAREDVTADVPLHIAAERAAAKGGCLGIEDYEALVKGTAKPRKRVKDSPALVLDTGAWRNGGYS